MKTWLSSWVSQLQNEEVYNNNILNNITHVYELQLFLAFKT